MKIMRTRMMQGTKGSRIQVNKKIDHSNPGLLEPSNPSSARCPRIDLGDQTAMLVFISKMTRFIKLLKPVFGEI
jgi:hypothetical protein